MILITFRIITLIVFFTELCFSQIMIKENHYLNQRNEHITIVFKDTVLTKYKKPLIKYTEFNNSRNRIVKSCIFDKDSFQIIESYFITDDFSSETLSSTKNSVTNIKFIQDGDTTYYNKVFQEPTNPISFITLLLRYSNIFTTKEVPLNLYIILPKSFKFIAKNKGIEKIKVQNKFIECFHISLDADNLFASLIMPKVDVWFEKSSKTMIKMEISDKYLIITKKRVGVLK